MTSEELPAIADGDDRESLSAEQLSVERYQASYRAGPLPSPADLAAYGSISPDLVSRIVDIADDERAHRHRMDRLRSRRASMGLAAGFAIAVLFLAVSAWLINDGHGVEGAVLGSFNVVALVTLFVVGRRDSPSS